MRKTVAIIVLTALTLIGCGKDNKLEEGRVIEKEYDDVDTGLACTMPGQNGTCLMFSTVVTDGEHWNLKVVGVDLDGKEREEWHEVTQTLFDAVVIGDTVNFPNMQRVMK